MSNSTTTNSPKSSATPWQDRLEDACHDKSLSSPLFEYLSDRRGGRTAWSCRVTIDGYFYQARYWYDGKNLNNAKEDAAERALRDLFNNSSSRWH